MISSKYGNISTLAGRLCVRYNNIVQFLPNELVNINLFYVWNKSLSMITAGLSNVNFGKPVHSVLYLTSCYQRQ